MSETDKEKLPDGALETQSHAEVVEDDLNTALIKDDTAKPGKKGISLTKKILAALIVGAFGLYIMSNIQGGGNEADKQEVKKGTGSVLLGSNPPVDGDPFADTTNPEVGDLRDDEEKTRAASAIETQLTGKEGGSLSPDSGAGPFRGGMDLPPEPEKNPGIQPTERDTSISATPGKAEEKPVNPKIEALSAFLGVYMSYPAPGTSGYTETAIQQEVEMQQQNVQAPQGNGTGEQQSAAKVYADAGDMAYGESTLTADSRNPGSPVRAVIRSGKLSGAVLMGTNEPLGASQQIFRMTSITIKGKGTYPVSAVLVNPEDYDMTTVSDEKRNPSFLRTLTAMGIKFASEFGMAKLNNGAETIISSNAVVTTNGRKSNKQLALGALGSGIGGAEGAIQGYIDEKLQPYSKVYPGKEVGILFLSSVVI